MEAAANLKVRIRVFEALRWYRMVKRYYNCKSNSQGYLEDKIPSGFSQVSPYPSTKTEQKEAWLLPAGPMHVHRHSLHIYAHASRNENQAAMSSSKLAYFP